ncbi:MAG: amidohydrolase family protein [Actinomycetota bacterium]|nr:amidohydrolase family protein [Actinomycetota bacterium]
MLLDSCAHPTCDGQWTQGRTGVTHAELAADLEAHNWQGALAIGLPEVGGYDHRVFMDLCAPHRSLIPVAALTTHHFGPALDADLDEIQERGYRIVKIHPRLLGYEHTLAALPMLIGECVARGLAVALCTYPEYKSEIDPDEARGQMAAAIAAHPEGHFITMHSGMLDPAPFAALAVDNPRILLDFSMSLTKYPDEMRARLIEIAGQTPSAISLGSDGPEWTYAQVRTALDDVASQLEPTAAEGFAGENLRAWLARIDAGLLP